MTPTVYLSLGSNVGDREAHLRAAIHLLEREVTVTGASSVYQTDPFGVIEQPDFLNLALSGQSALAPAALLDFVQQIEQEVGRRPTFRWGPRVVDIDILLYADHRIEDRRLVVPHPGLSTRAFVLVPLAEIAPTVIHPVEGRSIRELRDAVPGREGVRLFKSCVYD